MAMTVLQSALEGDDTIARQRREHAMRVDPKERFKNEKVVVEDGPADSKGNRQRSEIVLRYAVDSPYVFAVYSENKAFHSRGDSEWQASARVALQKFAAMRDLQIKFGPRPEDGTPFNHMAELDKPIEVSDEAKAVFAQQAKERAQKVERDEMLRKLGMLA